MLHPRTAPSPAPPATAPPRNRLLALLAPDDLAHLRPHLEPVELVLKAHVLEADARIEHVLFIEAGMVSLLADGASGRYEVGLSGPEGLIGLPVLFGVERSFHVATVQGPGEGLRVPSGVLRAAMEERPALRRVMLRYAHVQLVQVASTAHANAALEVSARLARWLLMMHDRTVGDAMPVTHDLLSLMLGTRRPGVTLAVQVLEGEGMIRATRGLIVVRDRAKLEAAAGEGYGRAEAEYEAVLTGAAVGDACEGVTGA